MTSDGFQRLVAAQRLLQRLVAAPQPAAVLDSLRGPAPDAASHGLTAADREALSQLDRRHLLVYRRLIRGTLADTFKAQLTRTADRLGSDGVAALVAGFCEQRLPCSQVLRDVAFEMCAWALPRWRDDPTVADFIPDLARFELMEFDVYAAQRSPRGWPQSAGDQLHPDSAVAFDGSMRLLQLAHRAHELPDETGDTSVPTAQVVHLLAYRDSDGDYRQLELTPLAAAMLERLWHGQPLAASIGAACEAQSQPLTQLVIDGISTVLADLNERGVVLGASAVGERLPPSPWAFRLYRDCDMGHSEVDGNERGRHNAS